VSAFVLDPRLESGSHRLGDWPLSQLRLKDDARFAWLLLIPRRPDVVELDDLADAEYRQLCCEILAATRLVRTVARPDKVNVGMLGNIVPQMHVHVVGRWRGDPAWPGSVWAAGAGPPIAPASLADQLRSWTAASTGFEPVPDVDGRVAPTPEPHA
jgi:diadenosine tetraphosphate (Ap4A) HIT family hydrolase